MSTDGAWPCPASRFSSFWPARSFFSALEPDPAGLPANYDKLVTLASQGKLKDPAVLEQQVKRMLVDPKAEALAGNFAEQWLFLRNLKTEAPNLMTTCARPCWRKLNSFSKASCTRTATFWI